MGSESIQWTNQNIEFASFGALAVQIFELANSFFDEVEYLRCSRFTFVKSLYLWSRYMPLIAQIVSLTLNHKTYQPPLRVQLCVGTFVYHTIVGQLAFACINAILLIRVYALYHQSRRVKYLLGTAFLTTCAIQTGCNSWFISTLVKGKSCTPDTLPFAPLVTICAAAFSFQALILGMTLFKCIVGRCYGLARTPLTSLLLREGVVVCFLISTLIVANIPQQGIRLLGSASGFENAALAWFVSLLSVTGCRLILDMRKLPISHPARTSDEDYGIEFTSILDLTRTN
ncbi:hypothetical protein BYT27DRAFT_7244323 [Phlegmacium glaucopus]|nr:hypothetical protein BYT27DRAFT_7244323 [Phlegmacium glaucopus]